MLQLLHEFIHERCILVVHIRPEKAVVAEGKDPPLDKDPDHNKDRDKKGKEKGSFLQECCFFTGAKLFHKKSFPFLFGLVQIKIGLFYNVDGTVLGFHVNMGDVFAEDSNGKLNNSAEEQNGT